MNSGFSVVWQDKLPRRMINIMTTGLLLHRAALRKSLGSFDGGAGSALPPADIVVGVFLFANVPYIRADSDCASILSFPSPLS